MARATHAFLAPLLRLPDGPAVSSDGGTEESKDKDHAAAVPLALPLQDRTALADAIRGHAGPLLESWAARHGESASLPLDRLPPRD